MQILVISEKREIRQKITNFCGTYYWVRFRPKLVPSATQLLTVLLCISLRNVRLTNCWFSNSVFLFYVYANFAFMNFVAHEYSTNWLVEHVVSVVLGAYLSTVSISVFDRTPK